MRRRILISLTVLILLSIAAFCSSSYVRHRIWGIAYNFTHSNPTVTEAAQIKEVLNSFKKVSYKELPGYYLKATKGNQAPFQKMMRGGTFYRVPYWQSHRKIVGDQPLSRFMPRDSYYAKATWNPRRQLFWLVNEKVLYKYLELYLAIEKVGHDPDVLYVVNGYRHPAYNQQVGGASRSRHIKGEAIDISVGDVNGDGSRDDADKKIVLDLLDQKIIRSFGGIGRYPGTHSVHMDVRGYRARWDKQ